MDFILAQKAKKTGGDKYVNVQTPSFMIYIPQEISRDSKGIPKPKIVVRFSEPQSEPEQVETKLIDPVLETKGRHVE